MVDKNYDNTDEELERIRDRLLIINKKVKKCSGFQGKPEHNGKISNDLNTASSPKNASLSEIREKLHTINDYLLKQVNDKETVVVSPKPPHTVSDTFEELPERTGIGLDLGTSYLVTARESRKRTVYTKNERNAFLSVRCDKVTQDLLKRLDIKYVRVNNQLYILGNAALDLANIFTREMQRSMSQGILNPSEAESIPIIKILIENILWSPREEGEACCFSVPANPIDRDQDTIYHRSVFESILKSLGFQPLTIDEGYAVVLSELEDKDFTGIGISCGGGMVNICAAFKSVPVVSFSITRGGDWIDKSAAAVLGISASRVTAAKEHGINIKTPAGREEEAIAIYYKHFIDYFLDSMAQVLYKNSNAPQFKEPVHMVFAGGTTLVGDFLSVVKDRLQNVDLGFDVASIKRAEDPFTSVSRGCLFNAINQISSK